MDLPLYEQLPHSPSPLLPQYPQKPDLRVSTSHLFADVPTHIREEKKFSGRKTASKSFGYEPAPLAPLVCNHRCPSSSQTSSQTPAFLHRSRDILLALQYNQHDEVGYTLPKSTYASWAAAMKLRLLEKGLWSFTFQPAYTQDGFRYKDQALATILGLDGAIRSMLINETDPARLWTALRVEFGGDKPPEPPEPPTSAEQTFCEDDWVVVHNHTNNQTPRRILFRDYQPLMRGEKRVLFEDRILPVAGHGNIDLRFLDPRGVTQTLTIAALHVPQASYNIFSLAANKLYLLPDASSGDWPIRSPSHVVLANCKQVTGRRVLRCGAP